jgi:hypothetical protein
VTFNCGICGRLVGEEECAGYAFGPTLLPDVGEVCDNCLPDEPPHHSLTPHDAYLEAKALIENLKRCGKWDDQ